MANIKNNTARLIHIGAAMCIPGMTTVVPDGWLDSPRVKELVADGSLTNVVAAGEATPKPIAPSQQPARPTAPAQPAPKT